MFRLLAGIGLVAVCVLFSRGDLRAAGATYSYDELGRLTGVLNDDNTGETYAYDDAGNRSATYSGHPSIFRIASITVNEGSAATLNVTRLGDATEAASVRYFTLAGTAVPTVNYAAVGEPGLLTSFAPTVSSQPVVIPTQDDNVYNFPLTYVVRLDDMSTNSAIDTAAGDATVTIVNTDPAPVFAISASPAVNEGGTITFTITKTNPTALTHTVSYETGGGTADNGADFTGASGTFTFAPSETSKTFDIATLTDVVYENAEVFTAVLSAPGNGAMLGTAYYAAATVNNTNTAPAFSVNTPSGVVEGQPITFTVTRIGGTELSHDVNYATANGTAVSPTNYTAVSGTLTFPPSASDATQTVTVVTRNDGVVAASKSFAFNLSNATSGAAISQATGTGTILEDANPPDMPATISPTNQFKTKGYWTVSWTAPTTGVATYYELYERIGTGPESLVSSGNYLSETFGPVSAGLNGEYFYRVRACNAHGCSPFKGTSRALICYQGYCD